MGKPTFYTAFANSMREEDFLPNLSEEATKISDLLQGLVFEDAIYYLKDEIFSGERMIQNFSKYGDKFDIFYFSGHAKNGALECSDKFIGNMSSMATVISCNLKNLKLAFFNACETYPLAQSIVDKKMINPPKAEDLILISCKSKINAFIAERFATLFFSQVGRPGTYYDAYVNARNLICLSNEKIVFKEFYDYDDMKSTTDVFDYAYIDVKAMLGKNNDGKESPPAAPVAPESTPTTSAPQPAHPSSIINPSKQAKDVLAANYLKEVMQTLSTSDKVAPQSVEALTAALNKTKQFVNGEVNKSALKNVWKEIGIVMPGLDPKTAMHSLVNIEKKDYSKTLTNFFKSADSNPTLANLTQTASTIKAGYG